MSDIKWIKISISMFDDEKIKIIESMPEKDTVICIWIKLLSLAGKVNNNGLIYISETMPYNNELLSTVFNRPLNTVKMAIETFQRMGMISILEDNKILVTNWNKYQNIEGMEKIRLLNNERQKKHRLLIKQRDCNVTVTEQIRIKDKDKDQDKDYDNIYILEKWNTFSCLQKCIKYPSKLDSTLKNYPFTKDQILQAISNYGEVIGHPEKYYFTHKWSLYDFIFRGKNERQAVAQFIDDARPLENFLSNKLPTTPKNKYESDFAGEAERIAKLNGG